MTMQKPFSAHRLLTLAALLAALPAAAAPGVTDLGTLENDNSGVQTQELSTATDHWWSGRLSTT